jgi:NADH:ubiquinone oxidoreductase subunit 3 (subunit A)
MKKIMPFLKSRPALYYLILFLVMIVPALLLFPAAEGDNQLGMITFLGLVILANLTAVFPFNSK